MSTLLKPLLKPLFKTFLEPKDNTLGLNRMRARADQQGVALVMVLMITLVIVALSSSLALAVFGEHRLSRNAADVAVARQAAEAALRDAEHDLLCQVWNGNGFVSAPAGGVRAYCNGVNLPVAKELGSAGTQVGAGILSTSNRCADGVVGAKQYDASVTTALGPDLTGVDCFVVFGTNTKQPALALLGAGVALRPPIYAIEVFADPSGDPKNAKYVYRLTARGFGRNPSTVVDLQEVYKPFPDTQGS
jgi:type IV pilus assembly protein PilX